MVRGCSTNIPGLFGLNTLTYTHIVTGSFDLRDLLSPDSVLNELQQVPKSLSPLFFIRSVMENY